MLSRCLLIRRIPFISSIHSVLLAKAGPSPTCNSLRWSSTSAPRHDPLRILFCGADEFSIYSLRALHTLQQQSREIVKSIDVVCRPDKRTGRNLKTIRQVPIKPIATELGLQLHQLDTFTGWTPPNPIDLIITVSFGLLVPSRLLNRATYGGINVHPSLLPDLKGPAPIQHALLQRREHTGASVQTMHPKTFDAGIVLAQTPQPGVEVPEAATVSAMIEKLGPLGAKMLVQSIRRGLFAPSTSPTAMSFGGQSALSHAPKLTPEDRHIDWKAWSSAEIALRDRVIGRLWDDTLHSHIKRQWEKSTSDARTRTTFEGPWREVNLADDRATHLTAGTPILYSDGANDHTKGSRLGIMCANGKAVTPTSATIASGKAGQGVASLVRWLREAGHEVYCASSVPLQ